MTDQLVAKLWRMAERGTPHEAEIARTKLEAMGAAPPPRKPPTAVGASPADDFEPASSGWGFAESGLSSAWMAGIRSMAGTYQRVSAATGSSAANATFTWTGGDTR